MLIFRLSRQRASTRPPPPAAAFILVFRRSTSEEEFLLISVRYSPPRRRAFEEFSVFLSLFFFLAAPSRPERTSEWIAEHVAIRNEASLVYIARTVPPSVVHTRTPCSPRTE